MKARREMIEDMVFPFIQGLLSLQDYHLSVCLESSPSLCYTERFPVPSMNHSCLTQFIAQLQAVCTFRCLQAHIGTPIVMPLNNQKLVIQHGNVSVSCSNKPEVFHYIDIHVSVHTEYDHKNDPRMNRT